MAKPWEQDEVVSAKPWDADPVVGAAPVSGAGAIPGIPGARERMAAEYAARQPDDSIGQRVLGTFELPAMLASGAVGSVAGGLAGIARTITSGKFGTQEGIREGDQTAGEVARALTYTPRTRTGKSLAEIASKVSEPLAPLAMLPSAELANMARAVAPASRSIRDMARASAVAQNADDAALASGGGSLRDLVRAPGPSMRGGGAALTEEATQRLQRAASMPVPPKLTRGQATRDFKDIQFEREAAKNPTAGAPLRERYSQQNQNTLQNIEAFFDETGAAEPNLYKTGKIVTDAVIAKAAKAKKEIRSAYDQARASGEMSETVDAQPVLEFIEKNKSAAEAAPILDALRKEVDRLATVQPAGVDALMNPVPAKVAISLNDMETLRQMANRLSTPGTPNSAYGPELKSVIDGITEGKGGELYKQARRMHENYSNEFKNVGVIDRLMKTKPGTKDRKVAYEDVYDKTIGSPGVSLDDVRKVRRTLQTAGPDGAQAWKELQGQGLQELKRETFGNVATDEHGRRVASPAKMNAWVEKMDDGGKLDFIYGKQGAEKIRDLRDMLLDTHTNPPNSVNTSNTASILFAMLDTGVSGLSGMPLPIATGANLAVKKLKARALDKRVKKSLNPEGGE